ncbi:MAG: hypothetical protein A2W74_08150 [Planctomycetes bacterium RIFCSPLOWO2_12_38_17]|nr:MAG: hypothetical protein A2W74_08150 [Planctomycetes bacterium RIFCSPLOWO2_12_38_17]
MKGRKMKAPLRVFFADLAHESYTGIYPAGLVFPLGIGCVASYAKMKFKDAVSFQLFRDPVKFSAEFLKAPPPIVGFSNINWALRLSYAYIERIKKLYPETIIILGGPNYPDKEPWKQLNFLESHPLVDFHVVGEGERAFCDLLEKIIEYGFNVKKLKENKIRIMGTHYTIGGSLTAGEKAPRISRDDNTPSPYLTGMFDEFFTGTYEPIVQFARGCPFSCTYCTEAQKYWNSVKRISLNRLEEELDYIAKRLPNKELTMHFADANMGMFKEDTDVFKIVADIQKKYGWPKRINASLGKNNPDNVLSAVSQLEYGSLWFSAAIQSADPEVLENIKRKNISTDKLIDAALRANEYNRGSNSEIILGLPGDSKKAHLFTVKSIVDAGISRVRMYVLAVFYGAELDHQDYREKFKLKTRFRILPRNFGNYEFNGDRFPVAEIGEIVVESSTMSYDDFAYCRYFDLSVEVFYNDHYFLEVKGFLNSLGISMFDFILKCHELTMEDMPKDLKEIYDSLHHNTESEMWNSIDELIQFIAGDGNLKEYEKREYENSLASLRAIGIWSCAESIHRIAEKSLKQLLIEKKINDEQLNLYVSEMIRFSLWRKNNLLETKMSYEDEYHFDFTALDKNGYNVNPLKHKLNNATKYRFWHEKEVEEEMLRLYSEKESHVVGLRWILFHSLGAKPANYYFRSFRVI